VYRRIVVALDGSERAERVLPYVEPLAERFGAALTLLRVAVSAEGVAARTFGRVAAPIASPLVDPTPAVEAEQRSAAAYLASVADRLRARGIPADHDQRQGPVAEAIAAYALELEADLIALTTHGRTGLGRAVLGSVAEAVVRRAPCPVLLVRVRE
jgi:nucleotide-binding universal stress UspA family protein